MDKKEVEYLISMIQNDMSWAKGKLNLMDSNSSGSVANECGDLISSLQMALDKAKKLREEARK